MRIRKVLLVVPILIMHLGACGQPVVIVKVGTAVPVPTGEPDGTWLGDTPVVPDRSVVKL